MSQNSGFQSILFQHCPCGILVTDQEGSILQLNEAMASMLDGQAEQFLGKTPQTLRPTVYQSLFKGSGVLHLAGPGIERERWLVCSEIDEPSGTTRFYQDVTQQVQLQQQVNTLLQQVEELTITDELTGLANPRALNRALSSQVTRSRRYDNPLCLAVIELMANSNSAADISDDAILATSRHLRDRLRWVDTIARWDQNHFVVILPETNAEHGTQLIEKICAGFSDIVIPSLQEGQTLQLGFGLAQWKKGDDSRLLMERAAQMLNAQGEQQIASAVT
ncbi:MAG: sensor domain-containing diguanylate cyclase [Gammaproteobacteria bacterium]|nr:sensor domain-containing diguanylate cyclase [Gammaproteobacteria bacterium]